MTVAAPTRLSCGLRLVMNGLGVFSAGLCFAGRCVGWRGFGGPTSATRGSKQVKTTAKANEKVKAQTQVTSWLWLAIRRGFENLHAAYF